MKLMVPVVAVFRKQCPVKFLLVTGSMLLKDIVGPSPSLDLLPGPVLNRYVLLQRTPNLIATKLPNC